MPTLQEVPVVSVWLESLKGMNKETIKTDTTTGIREWILTRKYRVTCCDLLIDSGALNKPPQDILNNEV